MFIAHRWLQTTRDHATDEGLTVLSSCACDYVAEHMQPSAKRRRRKKRAADPNRQVREKVLVPEKTDSLPSTLLVESAAAGTSQFLASVNNGEHGIQQVDQTVVSYHSCDGP